ncbi:hypothetical protein CMV_015414 [Castanea mollissima]|uniref:SMC hinge domain-containing protein n=1 Tax=Castanea mollissima TaxID=60419 RepID=A0A8J4R967_9ROSI|nr:hypothetical protein CMV_015414 [Castanea mollissima]
MGAYGPLVRGPLSLKWLWVPNKKNTPAHVFLDKYREQIALMLLGQVLWQPYEAELEDLPLWCVVGRAVWTTTMSLGVLGDMPPQHEYFDWFKRVTRRFIDIPGARLILMIEGYVCLLKCHPVGMKDHKDITDVLNVVQEIGRVKPPIPKNPNEEAVTPVTAATQSLSTTERPSTSRAPAERGSRPPVGTPRVVPTPDPSPSTPHPSPSPTIPSPSPHPSPSPTIPPLTPHPYPVSDIRPPTPRSFPELSPIPSFDLGIDPTPPDSQQQEPPSHNTSTSPSSTSTHPMFRLSSKKVNDTSIWTLAGGRYSNKDIVAAVILEVVLETSKKAVLQGSIDCLTDAQKQVDVILGKLKTKIASIADIQTDIEKKKLEVLGARKMEQECIKEQDALIPIEQAARQKAKVSNQIEGMYGRMGDLGAIDVKYDVDMSMACSGLDYIVVETTGAAQACVELLRRENLGVATFMILENQVEFLP